MTAAGMIREWIDRVSEMANEIQDGSEDDFRNQNGISREELVRLLTGGETIKVANASSIPGRISFGTMEDIGAGKILRNNPPYKGEWYGFQYNKSLPDGTPITAPIDVDHRGIMHPGDHFIEER